MAGNEKHRGAYLALSVAPTVAAVAALGACFLLYPTGVAKSLVPDAESLFQEPLAKCLDKWNGLSEWYGSGTISTFELAISGGARDEPQPETSTYLLPSDTQEITYEDLAGFDGSTLRLATEELYARHGWVFDDPDLAAYFESQLWYVPDETINYDTIEFSELEQLNYDVMVSYGKETGLL